MKKIFFLLVLFSVQVRAQAEITLEYTSEAPYTMAEKNSVEAIEKQLFASKLANDIIGRFLAAFEKDRIQKNYNYTLIIYHPDHPGTQHTITGVIKKTDLKDLLASETAFYNTLQEIYEYTSEWVLRYL